MENTITVVGKVLFEPDNKTKKHEVQSSWKKVAMVLIEGELTDYYAWFVEKRYNLVLNKPLRGAHISFINDSLKDMSLNGKRSLSEVEILWESVKNKWDGKEIPIMLDVSPRTDSKHWWLNIPHEYRDRLQGIREELGLDKPYWGMHMSIGYANEKNIDHSIYIHNLIKKGLITT